MIIRLLLIIILSTLSFRMNGQTIYQTENEKDIYWQPNAQIDFFDYQSADKKECIKYNEKYGFSMSSHIGLRGIVDIPKKGRKFDKFYVAPVFCKNCSCILSEDSLSLNVDRLLFDMAEVCARNIRRELLSMQKEMNSDNTYTMYFTTVKNKWDEKREDAFGSILREVLIEKKDSAYTEWRKLADDLLLQTINYATQPEDCHRFVTNEPIEKGYIRAKSIMGDMRKKSE